MWFEPMLQTSLSTTITWLQNFVYNSTQQNPLKDSHLIPDFTSPCRPAPYSADPPQSTASSCHRFPSCHMAVPSSGETVAEQMLGHHYDKQQSRFGRC